LSRPSSEPRGTDSGERRGGFENAWDRRNRDVANGPATLAILPAYLRKGSTVFWGSLMVLFVLDVVAGEILW
jgi:hypothetical protein